MRTDALATSSLVPLLGILVTSENMDMTPPDAFHFYLKIWPVWLAFVACCGFMVWLADARVRNWFYRSKEQPSPPATDKAA